MKFKHLVVCFVCFSQLVRIQPSSTGEEESLLVVQSYDDLSRKLWQLEGLPLSITAVQGAHPALRYTQVSYCFLYLTVMVNVDE